MAVAMFRPGVHNVAVDYGVEVVSPAGGGVAAPWWLSGGIAAVNCIAAYTPKGAVSLAASYDNNAAPGNGLPDGTYDAMVVQGRTPAWSAVRGWYNDQIGCRGLTTSVYPAKGWSYIIRLVNAGSA